MLWWVLSTLLWWLGSVLSFLALVEGVNHWINKKNVKPITSYKGFKVVITGASAGIGKELARQYASKGCRLLLAARRTEMLEQVKAECERLGSPEVMIAQTDVTDMRQCEAMIQHATNQWDGEIDLLILNAGRSCIVEYAKTPIGAVKEITELNCYGCFYPTWFALPALRKAHGRILVLSSVAGIAWTPMRTIYCASKHALYGFYNSLRCEEPDISVTLAYPSYVMSEIHDLAITERGIKLERNTQDFMATDVCVRLLIDGVAVGARDIYTEPLKSRFLRWVGAVCPGVADILIKKHANTAINKKTR